MQDYDISRDLKKIYQADKKLLEQTQVPIMTVSASFQEDLKGLHHQKEGR
jgi:acyl-CoA thioesterase